MCVNLQTWSTTWFHVLRSLDNPLFPYLVISPLRSHVFLEWATVEKRGFPVPSEGLIPRKTLYPGWDAVGGFQLGRSVVLWSNRGNRSLWMLVSRLRRQVLGVEWHHHNSMTGTWLSLDGVSFDKAKKYNLWPRSQATFHKIKQARELLVMWAHEGTSLDLMPELTLRTQKVIMTWNLMLHKSHK